MKLIAPAKLNLYLHITGRRKDGYHLLDSMFAFTNWGDHITLTHEKQLALIINGPYQSEFLHTAIEDNLVYRAARLLQKKYHVTQGVQITLTKNIPVSAGLGGGSSDAATILQGLNQFWKLNLDDTVLAAIGLSLGADIPACFVKKTAWVSGVGEHVQPIDLSFPDTPVLLINPKISLPTFKVFQAFQMQKHAVTLTRPLPQQDDWEKWINFLRQQKNDLTLPATHLVPSIVTLLSALQQTDCILARMSGSGATCFALFNEIQSQERATTQLRKQFPSYWIQNTTVKWI